MSLVFQNIDPPSPSPPGKCVLPPNKGRGTQAPGGDGGGGSIFWKTRDIGLPSYSDNLSPESVPPTIGAGRLFFPVHKDLREIVSFPKWNMHCACVSDIGQDTMQLLKRRMKASPPASHIPVPHPRDKSEVGSMRDFTLWPWVPGVGFLTASEKKKFANVMERGHDTL
jgi:hypothetical protein